MDQRRDVRIGRICIVAVMYIMMAMGSGRGDVASDAKWHPIAAAYLFAMFLTDLKPIGWSVIEAVRVVMRPSSANTQCSSP